MQLLRVVGAAMSRVADAAVSTFVTTASTDAGAADNVEANQTAAAMMPELMQAMDTILRRHVVQASRPATTRVKDGFEALQLGVGFVDLVGRRSWHGWCRSVWWARLLPSSNDVRPTW